MITLTIVRQQCQINWNNKIINILSPFTKLAILLFSCNGCWKRWIVTKPSSSSPVELSRKSPQKQKGIEMRPHYLSSVTRFLRQVMVHISENTRAEERKEWYWIIFTLTHFWPFPQTNELNLLFLSELQRIHVSLDEHPIQHTCHIE